MFVAIINSDMENKVIDFVSLERLFEVIPMTDDEAEVFEPFER